MKNSNSKINVAETTKSLIKVRVRVSSWLGNVKSNEGQQELAYNHNAEADAVSVGMNLLPKLVQKEIRDHAVGIRKALKKASLPFEDGGYRIMKATEYSKLNKEIQRRKDAFKTFIHDEIFMKYDEIRFMSQVRLGSLFDDEAFPSAETIMDRFDVHLFVQPIQNLEDLRITGMSESEIEKIKEDTMAEYERNLISGQMELVNGIRQAVEVIVGKTGNESSRYKRALEKLGELCDSVPSLNILDSDELNKLAKAIKTKIANVDSNVIKESENVKTNIKKQAESFVDALDKLSF